MSLPLDLYVRDPFLELRNKVNQLEQNAESAGASVGTGGTYASIQDALDGGERTITIVSDLTVTADPVATGSPIVLELIIADEHTVIFQNAAFRNSNGFTSVVIRGGRPTAVWLAASTPVTNPLVVIQYTAATHANTGLLDSVYGAVVQDLRVLEISTQDGAYLMNGCTTALVNAVFLDIQEQVPRTMGGIAGNTTLDTRRFHIELTASSNMTYISTTQHSRIERTNMVMTGLPNASIEINGDTVIEDGGFIGTHIVIASAEGAIMNNLLSNVFIEDTFGTEVLGTDEFMFQNCLITMAGDLDIAGDMVSFAGGYLDMNPGTYDLTVSGTACTLDHVSIRHQVANPVQVDGTGNVIIGCNVYRGGNFTASVLVGSTDARLIGNGFTALLADAGTNTKNVGNTP